MIQHIKTVTRENYSELWLENEDISNEDDTTDDKKVCTKKVIGLWETEHNLVHLLDTEIVTALEEEIGEFNEADESEESVVEKDGSQVLLHLALKHADTKFLDEILEDLKEYNTKKWGNYSSEQNTYSWIAMLSMPVQHFLEEKSHTETVSFVQLVCEWHSACDMQGL